MTDLLAPLEADEAVVRARLAPALEAALADPDTSIASFLSAL
jgi:hypothetical protein